MMTRNWEKWRPIGLKRTSGKALNPQGINKIIFKLISQVAKIGI